MTSRASLGAASLLVLALALLAAHWLAEIRHLATSSAGDPTKYHVALTAGDSLNQAWQTRLSYAHYLKLKREGEAAGVGSALGGFTRLLDSDRPDGLMEEIPTFLCGPWPEGIPQDYGPGRRAHSLLTWLTSRGPRGGALIPEQYVLLIEPDILIFSPPPVLATPTQPSSFDYGGVIRVKSLGYWLEKWNARPNVTADDMQATALSPAMFHKRQLEELCRHTHAIMQRMLAYKDWLVRFNWQAEMYAYVIAATQLEAGPVRHLTTLRSIYPPNDDVVDREGNPVHLLHFNHPFSFLPNGSRGPDLFSGTWRFGKRVHREKLPPLPLPLPPVRPGEHGSAVALVQALNEAACSLPGFVPADQMLRCEPYLPRPPQPPPAAAAGGEPRPWLTISIPSVPRDGGSTSYLQQTLESLLRQLPLDEADPFYGRVRVLVADFAPGGHDAYRALKRRAEEDSGPFGARAARYVEWVGAPPQLEDAMALCPRVKPSDIEVVPQVKDLVPCPDPSPEDQAQGAPTGAQRRQTLALSTLLYQAARLNSSYHMLMEASRGANIAGWPDDYEACPFMLQQLQHAISKASALPHLRGWAALRVSHGMSGVVLRGGELRELANLMQKSLFVGPYDWIFTGWLQQVHGGRPRPVYRYNLLRHVGEVSSFQGRRPPAGGFPACSDPLSGPSELLLEHERYNAACAGASDLSPCDASPPASGDGDGVAHLCAGHPAGCRRRQDV